MKRNFLSAFLCAVLVGGMLTSCESEQSPLTDNTKLWPAPQFSKDGSSKIGYINAKGEWAIQPIYDLGATFSNGVAVVGRYNEDKDETTYFYIDKNGNQKGSFEYAGQHYCGLAFATMDGDRWGFVDATAEWVIQPIYEDVYTFSDNLAKYYDTATENWGFIDKKGDVVIPAMNLLGYDYVSSFSEGYARYTMYDDEGYGTDGFIDKKGKIAINAQYDWAGSFSDGLALIEMNDRYGFINSKNETKISPIYDDADYFFENGLAPVEQNGKWGYINKKGDMKITPMFDYALPFCEGMAVIVMNDKVGVINTSGDIVVSPMYDDLVDDDELGEVSMYFHNGLLGVVQYTDNSTIYSYINKKGETVFSATYKEQQQVEDPFVPSLSTKIAKTKSDKKLKERKPTNHFTLRAPRR